MATDFSGDNALPLLDLLAAHAKIGDASAVHDMLVMLADLLAQDMPKIQHALLNHDMAVAGYLLHSLKGCMPIFCTAPICDQVALVERHVKLGESSQARQAYALLGPALAALALEIQRQLTKSAATQK